MKIAIRLLGAGAALLLSVEAKAQVDNPLNWDKFVQNADTILVSDTFRYQSFDPLEAKGWKYSVGQGEPKIKDISKLKIKNATGRYALQLYPGESVEFEPYDLGIYQDVIIYCPFAMRNIDRDERFMVSATVPGGENKVDQVYSIVPEDGFNSYFGQIIGMNADSTHSEFSSIRAGYGCSDITIKIGGTKRGDDSYYLLDHICAYGMIPAYSLFRGSGSWTDDERWTHQAALRHRKALINGEVFVEDSIHCDSIQVYEGEIRLSEEGKLTTRSLTIHKTFPEKGVWYFVSFPFDVYVQNISPEFQQGDEDTMTGGNYFYVQKYDGIGRANGGTDNWETVPIASAGEVLFYRGVGYLLALDAQATEQTLSFTSPSKTTLEYKPTVTLSIPGEQLQGAKEEDSGWSFCGNPLPGSVSLADIEAEGTDGNIYVYKDGTYKPYAIGSRNELPEGCAFFVKASGKAKLVFNASGASTAKRIGTSAMLRSSCAEPQGEMPTAVEGIASEGFSLVGDRLLMPVAEGKRTVSVYDFFGRLCFQRELPAEAQSVDIPLQAGFYIINVTENGTQQVWRSKWHKR